MSYFRLSQGTRKIMSNLLWVPVCLVFTKHFYTLKFIRGTSMQPTLNPDPLIWQDLVIFDRLSVQTYHDCKRGDVVALRSPLNPNMLIVKRIIALEGDIVQTLPPYPDSEVRIPDGHAWVEGDEAFRTIDSNRFGPVPVGLFDSRLVFILWPPNRFGGIPAPRSVPAHHNSAAWRRHFTEAERGITRSSRVRVKTE